MHKGRTRILILEHLFRFQWFHLKRDTLEARKGGRISDCRR
ncbi:hypothetical protein N185_22060 [Sinorhizobium sp. GW3]|nr:hypothetical protein N185_22060 [Sinorhizobium sp. GW3]